MHSNNKYKKLIKKINKLSFHPSRTSIMIVLK